MIYKKKVAENDFIYIKEKQSLYNAYIEEMKKMNKTELELRNLIENENIKMKKAYNEGVSDLILFKTKIFELKEKLKTLLNERKFFLAQYKHNNLIAGQLKESSNRQVYIEYIEKKEGIMKLVVK